MPRRVGIVGPGTAGSAAGIFSARAGHAVTLFERAQEELAVAGEGLVLRQRVDGLFCRTAGGKVLLDLEYAELDGLRSDLSFQSRERRHLARADRGRNLGRHARARCPRSRPRHGLAMRGDDQGALWLDAPLPSLEDRKDHLLRLVSEAESFLRQVVMRRSSTGELLTRCS